MFMVQTRSQSKGVKSTHGKENTQIPQTKGYKKYKPIIIDDEQDTPNTAETNCPTNTDAKFTY